MIALLQRVTRASVCVDGSTLGAIGRGLMVLVCAQRQDDKQSASRLADRLLRYRVFGDDAGRMNRSLVDLVGGLNPKQSVSQYAGLLLVPQFTLAADTRSGLRPSFTPAAPPELAENLFAEFVAACCANHPDVQTGRFGADMQVALVNDGPVTFWLQVEPN